MPFDIRSILSHLAGRRAIFHSEADFQFELAWEIQSQVTDARVRLEYRPLPHEAKALDIRIATPSQVFAVELKHLTKSLDVRVDGERFVLKNQGAHDISAYDCCKDLERLERFVAADVADSGYLVVLTNDSLYWRPPARRGAGYDAFRLFDGRPLSGRLEWGDRAGPGTRRGREAPIHLNNTYTLRWSDYSAVTTGPAGQFRVLVVAVRPTDQLSARGADAPTSRSDPDYAGQDIGSGRVERSVRSAVVEGAMLHTPTRGAPFIVEKVDSQGIVLLLGKGQWPTRITWNCLEGIVPYIKQHGGVVDIGGQHQVEGRPGTLDGYLKTCLSRTVAGWVAVVLETAGILEIVHSRPARVRLR